MDFAVFERALGLAEFFQALVGAFLLESFKFGDSFVELIVEAALLQGDVAEFLSISQLDMAEECAFAFAGVFFMSDELGAGVVADGVDAGFERSDAQQAPVVIGDGLDEIVFVVVDG